MLVRVYRRTQLLCLLLLVAGCTNHRRLEPQAVIRPDGGLGRNKIVGATLRDGREVRFDINSFTHVNRDTLRGSAARQPTLIPVADLQQVWVESTNVARTALLVAGVAAVFLVTAALAIASMSFEY